MKAFLLVSVLLLTGCGLQPRIEVAPQPDLWPEMPANIARDCDYLDATNAVDMGKLYGEHNELIGQYVECFKRNRAKADWYRNTKPKKAQ